MKKAVMMLSVLVILLTACAGTSLEYSAQNESQTGEMNIINPTKQSRNNLGSKQEGDKRSVSGKNTYQSSGTSLVNPDLTTTEIEGIKFMREEEKLARDVYLKLDEFWNMNMFSNISKSEQTHMDALLTLIDRYNLVDSMQGNEMGDFTNPDLQALYDELIVTGSISPADALLVGGAIEEIDILDLQEYLAMTSTGSVSGVYDNLLKGSINHLGAFVNAYERQTGETYQPQFLSQEEYQELISMSARNSGGQGRGRNTSTGGKGQARQ